MVRTNVSPPLPDQMSPLLGLLPGEIRNQVIELCILDARSTLRGLTISALPKWNGPACLRVEGMRALPLIFVNKQLHKEVLTYLDSMVEELIIGGYMLQFPNEDPRIRWNLIYSMLEKRPVLRRSVRDIKVSLPREGTEHCERHWASLGLHMRNIKQGNSKVWSILPSLEQSLNSFSAIHKLTVVVTVERNEPLDFNKLFSLYGIYRDRMTVEFKAGKFTGDRRRRAGDVVVWVEMWKVCWESLVAFQRQL